MRHIYQSTSGDARGNVVPSMTVSVFLENTTTAANVYAAATGGSPVNAVTTANDGSFLFWVDDNDYSLNQRFKITLTRTGYITKSYNNISVFAPVPSNTFYPDWNAADQGSTTNVWSVKSIINLVGSDNATIILRNNSGSITTPYTVATPLTIPTNIEIKSEIGAMFVKSGAGTLTMNGSIVGNPMHQWLSGFAAGEVVFGGNAVIDVIVEWFGAKADNSTDCSAPMQTAINACSTGHWVLTNDITDYYRITVGLEIAKPITFGSRHFHTSGNPINNVPSLLYDGTTNDNAYMIRLKDTFRARVNGIALDCNIKAGYGVHIFGDTAGASFCRVTDSYIRWFRKEAIEVYATGGTQVSRTQLKGVHTYTGAVTPDYSVGVCTLGGSNVDTLEIDGCHFDANSSYRPKNHIRLVAGSHSVINNTQFGQCADIADGTSGFDVYSNGANVHMNKIHSESDAILYMGAETQGIKRVSTLKGIHNQGGPGVVVNALASSMYLAPHSEHTIELESSTFGADIQFGSSVTKAQIRTVGVNFVSGKGWVDSNGKRAFGDIGTDGCYSAYNSEADLSLHKYANTHYITLVGNIGARINPVGATIQGMNTRIIFIQDGTGGRTVIWGGSEPWKFPDYQIPHPWAAASSKSQFDFTYDGTYVQCSKIVKNLGEQTIFTDSDPSGTLGFAEAGSVMVGDTSAGIKTITLPVGANGLVYTFVRSGVNAWRLDPDGTEVILGGGAGKYLSIDTNGGSVTLKCLSSVWYIIASYGTLSFEP